MIKNYGGGRFRNSLDDVSKIKGPRKISQEETLGHKNIEI